MDEYMKNKYLNKKKYEKKNLNILGFFFCKFLTL
jgi:hypothetical protein